MKIWEEMTDAERAPLIAANAEASRRRIEASATGKTHATRDGVEHTASSTYEQDRAKLDKLRADLKAKHPDATKVETEIGPQTRHMMQLADAERRRRRGEAGEARAGYLGVVSLPGGA